MEGFMEDALSTILSNNTKIARIFFLLVVITYLTICLQPMQAQSIYVPVQHEVYEFLKRTEARGLLNDYKDAAKPLSRMQIAFALIALEKHVNDMTHVERETFEFLKTEFNYEILKISGDPQPSEIRWHILSKELTKGVMNFDINFNYQRMYTDGELTSNRSLGLKTYGYVYDDVGFYFNMVDNKESGKLDTFRMHTPEQGIVHSRIGDNYFEYNESDAQFTWQIGSFAFSLEKNVNIWGYGKNGNVIFSNKAPSYPQFKMRVPISNNIDFVYFHGELNSNVIDSSRSYYVIYPNSSFTPFRQVDHFKYIAAHQIEISILNGIDLSIGESVIYSDRGPILIYLIPIMFFKSGEWYNRDKDNLQMFGSLDLNIIKNTNIYLSLFIDELNTDEIFDPNYSRRQVAFTSGVKFYDLPTMDFDLTIEYTRANPWVYNHKYPATTFTNNGYDLGHWIGQNADDLYLELGYSPMHSLRLALISEAYRKGGKADILYQYSADGGKLQFLYDLQHEEHTIGIIGHYQPIRDVFFKLSARVKKIRDINPSLNKTNQFEIYLSGGLGIW
jgi:hypothetical protein